MDELGLHAPDELVHHVEPAVRSPATGVVGALAWLVNTAVSELLGLVLCAAVLAVITAATTARTR